MNEPVASGEGKDDWLPGEPLGGKYYVQRLTTNMRGRTDKQIAKAWIARLCAAIRSVDRRHMITVGEIPWEQIFGKGAGNAFRDPEVCAPLDFLSVHLYPKEGKLNDDLAVLGLYKIGKPLVIEEIFPLSASAETTEMFIERSKPFVDGWISFYWGTTPADYEKRQGDANAARTANWLRRFTALRGELMGSARVPER
jgi:hypothetical protein